MAIMTGLIELKGTTRTGLMEVYIVLTSNLHALCQYLPCCFQFAMAMVYVIITSSIYSNPLQFAIYRFLHLLVHVVSCLVTF